ncbi:MAG: DUF2004 domain-containing protein [Ruminococcus sp.]|nr:DUF2004 domain-containing protein [Ruminococcus sp.]
MILNSKKFPGIDCDEDYGYFEYVTAPNGRSFYLSITEAVAANEEAAEKAAAALDDWETFEEKAKVAVKAALAGEESEPYNRVSDFMEFHRDEFDGDVIRSIFSADPSELTFEKMAERLGIADFSCQLGETDGKPYYVIDLCFDMDLSDERLAVYFDGKGEIFDILWES